MPCLFGPPAAAIQTPSPGQPPDKKGKKKSKGKGKTTQAVSSTTHIEKGRGDCLGAQPAQAPHLDERDQDEAIHVDLCGFAGMTWIPFLRMWFLGGRICDLLLGGGGRLWRHTGTVTARHTIGLPPNKSEGLQHRQVVVCGSYTCEQGVGAPTQAEEPAPPSVVGTDQVQQNGSQRDRQVQHNGRRTRDQQRGPPHCWRVHDGVPPPTRPPLHPPLHSGRPHPGCTCPASTHRRWRR